MHCDITVPDRASFEQEPGLPTEELQAEVSPIDLLAFMPLVRSIACRIYASIPPYASVDLNDLMQSGLLGLVHAGKSYETSRSVPFAVYARFRIRGEILDSLRQIDMASRSMRRLDKRIRLAKVDLTADLQREPTQSEIVQKLTDSLAGMGKRRGTNFMQLPSVAVTSLDERDVRAAEWCTTDPSPETLHSGDEARDLLGSAIDRLPARSRQLIYLYYRDGLTMRQIGERFCVNESRVSQIHRRALEKMARHLKAAGISSSREI